jgi:HD-GYP domain-containing protein (c-di-GMP phosphodiesterase class II)
LPIYIDPCLTDRPHANKIDDLIYALLTTSSSSFPISGSRTVTPQRRKLCQSLLIGIADLRLGMFVTELDRPWTQSPFMLQGFLLADQLDLQTLQSLVKEIVIDPTRSAPTSLLHLPWESLHEIPAAEFTSVPETRIRPGPASATGPSVHSAHSVNNAKHSFFVRGLEWLRSTADISSHFFRGVTPSQLALQEETNKRRIAAQPKPYYLRYDKTKNKEHASRSSKSNRTSKPPAPSTRQFSRLIQALYPRDVRFAPLNVVERWKMWQEQRNKDKQLPRGKNIRKRIIGRRRPDYLPKEFKLVSYKDHTPLQEEMAYARKVIEKTDALLKKLTNEISNDRSIALEEVSPTVHLLTESVVSNPSALIWLIRMRSENATAYAQGLKVAVYMMTLGRHLGFTRQQLTELGFIGLLLDIGKLELPDTLLDKPAKLSDEEHSLMRTHVSTGIDILNAKNPLTNNVLLGISEHHERLDGTGYPKGLTEVDISIFGKISAIADSFAAMTSTRPYDVTRSSFDAMKELFKMAGQQLHAPLVEEFVQAIGIFPIGSMIELSTGEIGIVLEHNKIRRLEPKVLLLTAPDKSLLKKPVITDLMRQKSTKEDEKMKILRGLPDGAYGLVCRDFYQS